ncbi:unnamed protein product [Mytilus edulis]|uniref:Uncharacterized protein n=1 Tax=Mytilus edulis TaxID=6550 RepID=A0A8S3TJF5_MYTED|nr:unnamed protein product [Mytilus edulis]
MECRDFDKLTDVIQNTKLSNAFYEIEQSLAELSDNIHIIRKDRENNLGRLSKEKTQIEQAIKQTRITINNHLDKIQDDIIKKLNETEVNESKIISELLISLKENDREITEIRTKIENIKQHATDLQTFIAMKELEKRISSKDQFLQSMINSGNFKDSDLTYNPNSAMQDLANRIKNFGDVKIEEKPCNLVLTRRKNKQAQILLPHILSRSVDNINLKLLQTINETGMYIRGCCMLPDGKMAFSHNSLKAVTVFNLDGTKDFEVNTGTYAFDVAYISHDNALAVTSGESYKKCITIIDLQRKQIKKQYQFILSITA